jgi:hypothetical protein
MNISGLIQGTVKHIPEPYLPANLALRFTSGIGYFTTDSDGNPAEHSRDLIVLASVRTDKSKAIQLEGQIGLNDIPLVGRCVEPKAIPSEVYLEKTAIAELTDFASGKTIKGIFRFSPIAQNRFTEVVEHMGERIQGFLVTEGRT